MKKLNITIIFILLFVLLFSEVAYALVYEQRFDANETDEETKNGNNSNNTNKNNSSKQNQQKKSSSSTTVPSYKIIPRSVTKIRDEKIQEAFKALAKGQLYAFSNIVGTYSYPVTITALVPVREPKGTIIDNWQLADMKKVEKEINETGHYILYVSGSLTNSTYANTNLRIRDYTWTVKNETTGTTRPKSVTKENYTYITFYEPGTYYIKAEETLIYDVNRVDRVSYQIIASHNSETLQSSVKTKTTYVKSETKPGKVTEWRIVITEKDVGKKILIGSSTWIGIKPIENSSSGPTNKLNVEVEYELVE